MASGNYGELKAKFCKAYANLPEPERAQVIAIIDDIPISWEKAYAELSEDTKLGEKVLEKMHLVGILQ